MSYLIYGAYGYTGTLIAHRAVEAGHEPILAGRDADRLDRVASQFDVPAEVVRLDAPGRLQGVLNEVEAVVHCAGPFVNTVGPMAAACLETGTHYLDITGEIPVFEALADREAQAEERGVMLLPGIGFDVVPTDCLARLLSEEMPDAETLELAVYGSGGLSKGTLKSVIEHAGTGGRVRREGRIVKVPLGWATRTVEFGDRPRTVVSIPWGDLVTANHSTGIPNITVYVALPPLGRLAFRLGEYLKDVLAWRPVKTLFQRGIERWMDNPSAETREKGHTRVWASVRKDTGERQTARLTGPEAYTFTARTAVAAAEHVMGGTAPAGFQTPSTAFGASFVDEIDGVEVERIGE
jgi:saccharopine dehydrogenase (NAD+, L-lysine-forming)